jgi:hypothetical protein
MWLNVSRRGVSRGDTLEIKGGGGEVVVVKRMLTKHVCGYWRPFDVSFGLGAGSAMRLRERCRHWSTRDRGR